MATTIEDIKAKKLNELAQTQLWRLGLLSLGLGAGARGTQGLIGLWQRNSQGEDKPEKHTIFLQPPGHKTAEDEGIMASIARPFKDAINGQGTVPGSLPWFYPAALAAGAGGMYGGYQIADHLMDARRRAAIQKELDDAKQVYEEALAGQSKLGQALDKACDKLEKTAMNSADYAGMGMGSVLALLGTMGLLAGKTTYDIAKKSRPSSILDKAKEQRRRRMMATMGAPISVQPAPEPESDETFV